VLCGHGSATVGLVAVAVVVVLEMVVGGGVVIAVVVSVVLCVGAVVVVVVVEPVELDGVADESVVEVPAATGVVEVGADGVVAVAGAGVVVVDVAGVVVCAELGGVVAAGVAVLVCDVVVPGGVFDWPVVVVVVPASATAAVGSKTIRKAVMSAHAKGATNLGAASLRRFVRRERPTSRRISAACRPDAGSPSQFDSLLQHMRCPRASHIKHAGHEGEHRRSWGPSQSELGAGVNPSPPYSPLDHHRTHDVIRVPRGADRVHKSETL
jgi:hypothetical protein